MDGCVCVCVYVNRSGVRGFEGGREGGREG